MLSKNYGRVFVFCRSRMMYHPTFSRLRLLLSYESIASRSIGRDRAAHLTTKAEMATKIEPIPP